MSYIRTTDGMKFVYHSDIRNEYPDNEFPEIITDEILANLDIVPEIIENVNPGAKPFDSWRLDDDLLWRPPSPKPDDGNEYRWSEDDLTWIQI